MDVVRVSNNININEVGGLGQQQQQQQQPQQSQQLQTPQQQQQQQQHNSKGHGPRNGLNQFSTPNSSSSPSVAPGSSGSLGSEGLLHQASASSDSGNSSCVSGVSTAGAGPDDPETKNDASFGSSASAGEVTVTVEEEGGDRGRGRPLLLKKQKANIYVNKVYDDEGRGSSTETDDRDVEDVKPLLVEHEKPRKPKSIVKSPSNLSFGKELSGGAGKPRLNLQFQQPVESVIEDSRPAVVHHVQFSKQQDNGYGYGLPEEQKELGNGTAKGAAVCGSPVGSILSRGSGGSSTSSSGSSSNENSSLGGYAEARPPDGGWGWVVCFASFMVNLIADGVTFSFGVLYVELLDYFGEGKGESISVFLGVENPE